MSLAEKACDPLRGQRGGARFNLIVLLVFIALAAYCAYNYAPVAYDAYLYRDFMQETVNKAAYPPAKSSEWVRQQLRQGGGEYDLPDDAVISVQNENGRIAARVTYTRTVQLPFYVYEYQCDHTAKSSGFIQ